MGTNGFDIQHPLDKRIDYIFTTNYEIISHRHIDDRLNNILLFLIITCDD